MFRDDLDNRQNADFKYDLFHKVVVFQQCGGPVAEGFGKVKPGNQPRCQPKHIGGLGAVSQHLGLRIQPFFKYDPVNKYGDHRLYKCPDNPQIGTGKPCFKIIFGQFPDQSAVLI